MMKSKLLIYGILVAVGIILISGCVQQIPQEPNQEQEDLINVDLDTLFQLEANQIAFIEPEGLKIKFFNITEDSRCPSDVQCFWEGQITIVVNIEKDDSNLGDFNLTARSGHEDLAIKTFDGYSIKLIKVDPYPKTTQKIRLSDYVVSLIVSKNI